MPGRLELAEPDVVVITGFDELVLLEAEREIDDSVLEED